MDTSQAREREQLAQAFAVRCGKTTLSSGVIATRYPTLIVNGQFTVKVKMVHPQLKHWHIQGVGTGTTEGEALKQAVGIWVQLACQRQAPPKLG
jgi:hypothetical protein